MLGSELMVKFYAIHYENTPKHTEIQTIQLVNFTWMDHNDKWPHITNEYIFLLKCTTLKMFLHLKCPTLKNVRVVKKFSFNLQLLQSNPFKALSDT